MILLMFRSLVWCRSLSVPLILLASGFAAFGEQLTGYLEAHDPSTILKCNGRYWTFTTGRGVSSLWSTNLLEWHRGAQVFKTPPSWAASVIPGNRSFFWAPDIVKLTNGYYLYYSVSTWGSPVSAIGLATNPTLDPQDPKYEWTDRGVVIQSARSNNFNAIDPSILLDREGHLWMAFGSFWSGIKLIELDPASGLRARPEGRVHSLAWKEEIEAAFLCQRGDYYYLFVNWGLCCRGTNSTYSIRVGRSGFATGPYLDKSGKDLMQGGGTPFHETKDSMIGPGHAAIVTKDGREFVSFHYYDGRRSGAKTLGILPLAWSADGWPEVTF
jgi:arabinan endo-1,5-alpha-L-arabinosidase